MTDRELPPWLAWAREIQAVCQTGLAFAKTPYDAERYRRLARVAAEMAAAAGGLDAPAWGATFLAHPGYATPKVDVRGAVVRDGRVLLVQESEDGRWALPGGWADVGETPSAMVEREVREESGLTVRARRVIGVFDANREPGRPLEFFHAYKLLFLCEDGGGEPRSGDETLAAAFFPFDEVPPLSLLRTHPRHLAAVQAHLRDPGAAVEFD